jgi:hypothetical protein
MGIREVGCEVLGQKFQERFVGGRTAFRFLCGFAYHRQDETPVK